MKKIVLIVCGMLFAFAAIGCSEPEVKKSAETEQTSTDEMVPESSEESEDINISIKWEDGTIPDAFGNDKKKLTIKDANVVVTASDVVLVMDVEYSNKDSQASNLINDPVCAVVPYQNGVVLETPGFTTEPGYYDYSDAFADVKSGGVVNTQLVWSLRDANAPIEIDFGTDEHYRPKFSETLILSGAEGFELVKSPFPVKTESDYEIVWKDNKESKEVGGGDSVAKIKGSRIIESSTYGTLLVMDFEYTNHAKKEKDFINDDNCHVQVYQNGVELDSTGITSEMYEFNYSDAYLRVRNGGTINTQLVWVLNDTKNPVELELGYDERYQPDEVVSFTIKAKQ